MIRIGSFSQHSKTQRKHFKHDLKFIISTIIGLDMGIKFHFVTIDTSKQRRGIVARWCCPHDRVVPRVSALYTVERIGKGDCDFRIKAVVLHHYHSFFSLAGFFFDG